MTVIGSKIKETWRKFKVLWILYFIFVALWLPLKIYFHELCCWFDHQHDFGDGFFLSWFSSYTEDLLFFGTTGLLALIITTKLPKDEEFEVRISALANNHKVSKNAANFLKEEMVKNLAYSQQYCLEIEIQRVSLDRKYLFLHVKMINDVMNMCKDVEVPLQINSEVHSDADIENVQSYISLHKITSKKSDGSDIKTEFIVEEGRWLNLHTLDNKTYQTQIFTKVPDNGFASQTLVVGIWNWLNGNRGDDNNWLTLPISGYVENFILKITNMLTDIDIFYDYRYIERLKNGKNDAKEVKGCVIKPKITENVVENLQFYRNDVFGIFFYTK